MGKIDNDAEALAFADEVAAKRRKSFRRRAARGKNSTVTGGVCPRMSQSNFADARFIKRGQQIQIVTDRLDAFHRDEESDLLGIESALNVFGRVTNDAPLRLLRFNLKSRDLIPRDLRAALGKIFVL